MFNLQIETDTKCSDRFWTSVSRVLFFVLVCFDLVFDDQIAGHPLTWPLANSYAVMSPPGYPYWVQSMYRTPPAPRLSSSIPMGNLRIPISLPHDQGSRVAISPYPYHHAAPTPTRYDPYPPEDVIAYQNDQRKGGDVVIVVKSDRPRRLKLKLRKKGSRRRFNADGGYKSDDSTSSTSDVTLEDATSASSPVEGDIGVGSNENPNSETPNSDQTKNIPEAVESGEGFNSGTLSPVAAQEESSETAELYPRSNDLSSASTNPSVGGGDAAAPVSDQNLADTAQDSRANVDINPTQNSVAENDKAGALGDTSEVKSSVEGNIADSSSSPANIGGGNTDEGQTTPQNTDRHLEVNQGAPNTNGNIQTVAEDDKAGVVVYDPDANRSAEARMNITGSSSLPVTSTNNDASEKNDAQRIQIQDSQSTIGHPDTVENSPNNKISSLDVRDSSIPLTSDTSGGSTRDDEAESSLKSDSAKASNSSDTGDSVQNSAPDRTDALSDAAQKDGSDKDNQTDSSSNQLSTGVSAVESSQSR